MRDRRNQMLPSAGKHQETPQKPEERPWRPQDDTKQESKDTVQVESTKMNGMFVLLYRNCNMA